MRFLFDNNEYFENMLVVVRIKEDLEDNFEVIESDKLVWKTDKDLIANFLDDAGMKSICVLFFEPEILKEGKVKDQFLQLQKDIAKTFVQEVIPNSLECYLGLRNTS